MSDLCVVDTQGQGQPQTSQVGRALGGGGDPQSSGGAGPAVALPPGHPNYDQMQRFYQQQAAARGSAGGAAAGAAADPKPSGAGGAQGQPDRFGLLGLLSVIRMTDPDLTTLVRSKTNVTAYIFCRSHLQSSASVSQRQSVLVHAISCGPPLQCSIAVINLSTQCRRWART